ncbi:hypothetical protein BPT24_079 [Tenacibaculum phage pT24]|uniref:Uncharacterized protein n=1 Tax=Tenacibaculum phage pT24 TaxID=1880590 RepID=A0A1B4XWN8_9CAUD|nr:hypothetical protein HYP10_gp079 [Tenacibaculum phage pT24]BAV39204.1 hypothetical protein BPT24_079 [Tenacibaculum phage pT24]
MKEIKSLIKTKDYIIQIDNHSKTITLVAGEIPQFVFSEVLELYQNYKVCSRHSIDNIIVDEKIMTVEKEVLTVTEKDESRMSNHPRQSWVTSTTY